MSLPSRPPLFRRWKKSLKRLARSGDFAFAFGLGPRWQERTLKWKGHRIVYRALTSDPEHIERLLLLGQRCEYNLPRTISPQYVLDAGGNIGLASLYFSELFPSAKIICCEPSPENVALARRNTAGLTNVTVIQCGLAGRSGRGEIKPTACAYDYSGLSVNESAGGDIPIYDYRALLAATGVPGFDLIKIDIEGDEYGFLSSLDEAALQRCQWIVGEVHGKDEWRLLDFLSGHFAIDIKKRLGGAQSKFHAGNRAHLDRLLAGFDIAILQK